MEVRCPQCRNPIEIAGDTKLSDISCVNCGSTFSLLGEETIIFQDTAKHEKFGHFELVEKLGVGSFGSVWKARDIELDRTVAIKVPRTGRLSPTESDQFLREARAAAQLNHANIVAVHEVGRHEDTVYIVSEYVRGVTLADHLTREPLNFREAAELCAKIADAVHHAHEAGVIHRDLKPGNIMLDAEGEPHIMDFGLAKRQVGEVTMTVDGKIFGTPAYMSPEQAEGKGHDADNRTDIYSLGVVLFELLTGEPPFRGDIITIVQRVIHEDASSPRKLNSDAPHDLETICLKCLEKEPRKRYLTASALASDLRRWLNGEPIQARSISQRERLWRWCRRNPTAVLLVVIFFASAAAILWHMSNLSSKLLRTTALQNAAQYNNAQREFRTLYTSEVVENIRGHGIEVTHDYKTKQGAIPLPVTLSMALGDRIAEQGGNGESRLYSPYPFPWRQETGGLQDDFAREAWDFFSRDPYKAFFRFENLNGEHSLRYATADLMRSSCVDCHNTHPDSPKSDWKEGDVRGVLEIVLPLGDAIAQTRTGLWGAWVLFAIMTVLGWFGLVLLVVRRS